MNGYPKEIFYNHVKKFLCEKLMTTNSCQNKNDEKKYTLILFIGHPSIIFKKLSTKNLKSINKKCTLFKTINIQNYISLKMKLHWPCKQMSLIFLKVIVVRTKPILVNKKHLATRVREHLSGNSAIYEHVSSCNACNHSEFTYCITW